METEVEIEIHSYHIICDDEFIHHTVGVTCECHPENFQGTNVWHHQRKVTRKSKKPSSYRTYKLNIDGTWDMVLPQDVPWFKGDK